MGSLFLETLQGTVGCRPPVWLMRQAGRYMPSYQKLRTQYSLETLFHTPDLAAEITLQPIETFGMDAAIVFSDILVIAEVLGLKIQFPLKGGPQVFPRIKGDHKLSILPVEETLSYVMQTIQLLKPKLLIPLIGFCGGPFTVATYLIEGEMAVWMETAKKQLHALLQILTEASCAYVKAQIKAGVNAVQVFDSWAGKLSQKEREEFVYPYVRPILQVAREAHIPSLFFTKNASLFPEELLDLGASALSFDDKRPLSSLRELIAPYLTVQGNLDPEILATSTPLEVEKKTRELLETMRGKGRWIANLGHGVLPHTPMENVFAFVDTIKKGSTQGG